MTRRPAGAAVAALILLVACTHHTTAPAGDGSASSREAAMWAAAAEPKVEECELRFEGLDNLRPVSPAPDLLQAYRSTVPSLRPPELAPQPGTNPHYYAARLRGAPVGLVLVDQTAPRGLPSRVAFVFSAQGKLLNIGGPTYALDLPVGCPTGRP